MLSYTSSMVVFTALSVKQYACMQFCNNYSLNRVICKKTLQREIKGHMNLLMTKITQTTGLLSQALGFQIALVTRFLFRVQ